MRSPAHTKLRRMMAPSLSRAAPSDPRQAHNSRQLSGNGRKRNVAKWERTACRSLRASTITARTPTSSRARNIHRRPWHSAAADAPRQRPARRGAAAVGLFIAYAAGRTRMRARRCVILRLLAFDGTNQLWIATHAMRSIYFTLAHFRADCVLCTTVRCSASGPGADVGG